MHPEKLPGFLIIGAQKSGTTTLYGDLSHHPGISFGAYKETGALCSDDARTPEGRRKYAANYRTASAAVLGDATTDYTKRTRFAGVPERARRILGPELRLIYLVREPVSRAISHHYHGVSRKTLPADFGTALNEHPSLVDNGRYAFQLDAWLEHFPQEQLKVVRFEDYLADRAGTTQGLLSFLDLPPASLKADDPGLNRSGELGAAVGLWARVHRSSVYRATLRRVLPDDLRLRIRGLVVPGPPPRPAPPTLAQVDEMLEVLRPDVERLATVLGMDRPPWDLDAVRTRFAS
jgi:hypothetical protein